MALGIGLVERGRSALSERGMDDLFLEEGYLNMPGAIDRGWWKEDDPRYQNAEWTIHFGQLLGVKPKPVEPEPRTDPWENTESERKFFEEMEERQLHRQSDQED